MAVALRESALFPPMLIQVTAAGEKSGQLEEMLLRVADSYEHQTDLAISGLLALLEPLMILVMGGIVGFVVLAILLPIFQASQGFVITSYSIHYTKLYDLTKSFPAAAPSKRSLVIRSRSATSTMR